MKLKTLIAAAVFYTAAGAANAYEVYQYVGWPFWYNNKVTPGIQALMVVPFLEPNQTHMLIAGYQMSAILGVPCLAGPMLFMISTDKHDNIIDWAFNFTSADGTITGYVDSTEDHYYSTAIGVNMSSHAAGHWFRAPFEQFPNLPTCEK